MNNPVYVFVYISYFKPNKSGKTGFPRLTFLATTFRQCTSRLRGPQNVTRKYENNTMLPWFNEIAIIRTAGRWVTVCNIWRLIAGTVKIWKYRNGYRMLNLSILIYDLMMEKKHGFTKKIHSDIQTAVTCCNENMKIWNR